METQIITSSDNEESLLQESDVKSVTAMNVIVDGSVDKEATILDSKFGASSVASSASGIPSAIHQLQKENLEPTVNVAAINEAEASERS